MKSLISFINEQQNFLIKGHTKKQQQELTLEQIYVYFDTLFGSMYDNFGYTHVQTISKPNKSVKYIKIGEYYNKINVKDIEKIPQIKYKYIKNIDFNTKEDGVLCIRYNYEEQNTPHSIIIYMITNVGIRRNKYVFN